jgi:hypothetical protein
VARVFSPKNTGGYGNTTLCEWYSTLYNIVRHKDDTIATTMTSSPPAVSSFRTDLVGPRLAVWNVLLGIYTPMVHFW